MTGFLRISSDPTILGGKPCIKGMRLGVELIHGLIAGGAADDDILRVNPRHTTEDLG